jgi:hypothetical protein
MNERDIERIIDRATADLVRHQPSGALRRSVMARVRGPQAPTPRRFVWATGVVMAMLCAAIAIALIIRAGSDPVGDDIVRLTPDATATARNIELSPDPSLGGVRLQPTGGVRGQPGRQSAPPGARPTTFPPNDLLSSIEPVVAEPLQLPSIDVAPLENQGTPVEALNIEALTIEPLTASND